MSGLFEANVVNIILYTAASNFDFNLHMFNDDDYIFNLRSSVLGLRNTTVARW